MSPTGRYAIVFWKGLSKDNVAIRDFNDEQEMTTFAENLKMSGYAVLVGEVIHVARSGEKTFKLRKYGAYPVIKNWYKYFGLFLVALVIVLILAWK